MNYYITPMNFNDFNFKKMKEEIKENKSVLWAIPNRSNKNENCKNIYKENDVVYIYVTHLPSCDGKNLSRVLLKAEICRDEKRIKYFNKDFCFGIAKREKFKWVKPKSENVFAISLKNFTTIEEKSLKDNKLFNIKYFDGDKKQNIPKKMNHPQKLQSLKNYKNIIKDLNEKFDTEKCQLDVLINYFNQKCFFKDILDRKHKHISFLRSNGTYYYEGHHFIQQNIKRKNPDLRKIIDDDENNIINLCSNCHNELHYGDFSVRKNMIKRVWEAKKNFLIKNGIIKILGLNFEDEVLDWINNTYIINNENTHKDVIECQDDNK